MKIEISIEKEGKHKKSMDESGEDMDMNELSDDQKLELGKKIKKNISLTRMERNMLAEYLMSEKED